MIKLTVTDPHSHTSQQLRQVIHYLSTVAADLETVTPHVGATPAVEVVEPLKPAAPAATVVTQETLPPVQYETVAVGHITGPTPYAEGHNRETYENAGWTLEALVEAGHLIEVTEQRPLAVAPSASAAPSAPTPGTAPALSEQHTINGVEVDKDGLPWDARIHSDAEVKKAATGRWKRRRNVAEEEVTRVEAELRDLMAVPVGNAPPAPTAPAPASVTMATAAPTPPPPAAPSAPPAPAPAPAPAASNVDPSTFADLMRWVTGHVSARALEQTHVQQTLIAIGLKNLPELNIRPDLIPTFVQRIKDDYL